MTKRLIAAGRIGPIKAGKAARLDNKMVEVVHVRADRVLVKFFDVRDGWRKWWVDKGDLASR